MPTRRGLVEKKLHTIRQDEPSACMHLVRMCTPTLNARKSVESGLLNRDLSADHSSMDIPKVRVFCD